MLRQAALGELARAPLLGAPLRPLLEKATQLVLAALDAEACAIYEYLPGGHDLLVRAAAARPGGRRRLTTLDGGRRLALFDDRMRVGSEDVLSPEEPAAPGLAWLHSGSTVSGVAGSAGGGRLLARMVDLLEEIERPERLDLRDGPAR